CVFFFFFGWLCDLCFCVWLVWCLGVLVWGCCFRCVGLGFWFGWVVFVGWGGVVFGVVFGVVVFVGWVCGFGVWGGGGMGFLLWVVVWGGLFVVGGLWWCFCGWGGCGGCGWGVGGVVCGWGVGWFFVGLEGFVVGGVMFGLVVV
ncbi:hypothetical protein, partial [Pseudomonas syringae group genomosp. 7]|uniref:hypothetical protein n=1 Tax=Pseudomonas syringae group genomosp. 7 TaxID=251699 RepID=UPI00376F6C6F